MSIARAFDLLITWNPNTDSDLAGYNVSYDGPTSTRWTTPCNAYQVSSQGVSLYTTTYTITGASNGNYSIYIRAYDTNGNMSSYTPYVGTVSGGNTWTVTGSEPTPCIPEALFSLSTSTGVGWVNVTCTNESTVNSPDTWLWSIFNDGNTTIVPNYTYTTEDITREFGTGTTSIRLRVWNDNWFDDYWLYTYVTGNPMRNVVLKGATVQ
jgi:hypothetical protein